MKALWNGRVEWCFWTLHWYRLIVLRLCTFVPVGSALPGDVWPRYWFELMTHGSYNFQQTNYLLIWGLRFLPSSPGPNSSSSPAFQSGSTSLSVFITAPACWLGLGISVHQCNNLFRIWRKRNMPLNILWQTVDRSYSLMHFATCAWSNGALTRRSSIWLPRIDSNWWSLLPSKTSEPHFVLHVLFKYVLWNDKTSSPLSPWGCEIVFLMMF